MVLPSALKFPDVYSKFISCFSFVNLALLPRFLRLDCVMSVDHYGHVFFMTLAPLLVFALGYAGFKVHTQQMTDDTSNKHLQDVYLFWFLLGTYMIYPSVSTTLFQTQRCEFFDWPEEEGDDHAIAYLRVDLRLECGHGRVSKSMSDFHWNTQYDLMWTYAMLFVLVYPIGEERNRGLLRPTH